MLENHTKILFHREWEQPNLKGRPRHPLKVHVWGGISKQGTTKLLIFDGKMDAGFYVSQILSNRLLPFIRKACRSKLLPAGQRSQADEPPSLWRRMTSTGGRLLQNYQTETLSSFYGMNSNTFYET